MRLAAYAAAGEDGVEDDRGDALRALRSSFSRCCSAACIAAATTGSRMCFEGGVGGGRPSGMAEREFIVVAAVGLGGAMEDVELPGEDDTDETDDRFALLVVVRYGRLVGAAKSNP